jgi:hypothetical protein
MINEPTITLLDAYRQELIEARAKRQIIQGKVDAGEDLDYYTKVLANWDYDIRQIEARIRREEATCTSS